MTFIEGEIYLDRNNNEYVYCYRSGNVLVFTEVATQSKIVQHSSGRYRWDDVDDPRDIIIMKEKNEFSI